MIVFLASWITFTIPFLCPVARYLPSADYSLTPSQHNYNGHRHDESARCIDLANDIKCLVVKGTHSSG